MPAGGPILRLIPAGTLARIAALRARWAGRRSRRLGGQPHGAGPDRADRLDRQVTHYRASGALPRWDP